MATKYKVNWNLDFGKKQYREGDQISGDAIPVAQLPVLLKCGVITPIDGDGADLEPAQPPTGDTPPADKPTGVIDPAELAKCSKAMLADYAKEQYGLSLKPADMTKDALLAQIAEAAAKAAK